MVGSYAAFFVILIGGGLLLQTENEVVQAGVRYSMFPAAGAIVGGIIGTTAGLLLSIRGEAGWRGDWAVNLSLAWAVHGASFWLIGLPLTALAASSTESPAPDLSSAAGS
jgi:hypothetical protein